MQINLWNGFIVQERAKLAFEKIYTRNAFPTALILFGQKGSGKEAHAVAFAQSINCETNNFQPCGICDRCRRIANFLTPELYFIYPTPTNPADKNLFQKKIQQIIEKKK